MKQGRPDLETAISTIDLLDHQRVDWSRVQCSVYLVHQHLRYEYPGPIKDLHQRLMILPPHQYGDQRLLEHRLSILEQRTGGGQARLGVVKAEACEGRGRAKAARSQRGARLLSYRRQGELCLCADPRGL